MNQLSDWQITSLENTQIRPLPCFNKHTHYPFSKARFVTCDVLPSYLCWYSNIPPCSCVLLLTNSADSLDLDLSMLNIPLSSSALGGNIFPQNGINMDWKIDEIGIVNLIPLVEHKVSKLLLFQLFSAQIVHFLPELMAEYSPCSLFPDYSHLWSSLPGLSPPAPARPSVTALSISMLNIRACPF